LSLLLLSLLVLPVARADEPAAAPRTVHARVPFSALGESPNVSGWRRTFVFGPAPATSWASGFAVWLAAPAGRPVSGTIAWEDDGRWKHARFEVADLAPHAVEKERWDKARAGYYEGLTDARVPGSALFRARRSELVGDEPPEPRRRAAWRRVRSGDRFDLFTGGRAFTENLQLDRHLPATERGQPTVALDSLKGVTVDPYEWKLPDGEIALDPLARFVPADQYAVFFATPRALRKTAALVRDQGTPLLRWMEPRAEDRRVLERYEEQLALDLDALRGLTVALTGSDPYFADGTDVALVVEGAVAANLASPEDVRVVRGESSGIEWHGFLRGRREVSSYRADVEGAVVISNSRHQLERVLATAAKASPSLASLDEYRFFRHRYKHGEDEAFLMVPDAAIRKWCSPKWRIGAARRRLVLSEMLDRQARIADGAQGDPAPVESLDMELRRAGAFVHSPVYGTPGFLTPIAELDFEKVTKQEARLYRAWRQGYESNWSTFFDPIAARLSTDADGLAFDVSIIPLIGNSDYEEYVEVARGAKIAADANDRHPESLLHMAFAIDSDSEAVKRGWSFLQPMTRIEVNPMAWLGTSWSAYVDRDPFFGEMARAEDPGEFLEANWHRFPGAIQCEVKNRAKLVVFLVGARGFIEQAAPGMTEWSVAKHAGREYTTIRLHTSAEWNLDKLRIHYAVAENGLTATLNENVMKRALERAAARADDAAEAKDGDAFEPAPWLGDHMAVQGRGELADLFDGVAGDQGFLAKMRRKSYLNLYALNEWKRLYPDADPVAVHERVFGTRLVCPGGGDYVWNAKAHTMESTVFGHPAAPKEAELTPAYRQWAALNAGVTFEDDGLHAKLRLQRRR